MEHEQAVTDLAVEAYLLGEMSLSEREAFEEHYFSCAVCAEDVRSAARFIDEAKDVLRHGEPGNAAETSIRPLLSQTPAPTGPVALPERQTPGRSGTDFGKGWLDWLRPQIAVPALAALLLLIGFQNVATIPGLRQQLEEAQTPRMLASAVLRPQTRGAAATVMAPAGSPALLVFDLLETPASGLEFVIESSNDGVVLELSGAAPEPGRPVNLLIPELDLPAGLYTLVTNSAADGRELGRYPFQLEHP